jgi:DASH complex subunit DAM1
MSTTPAVAPRSLSQSRRAQTPPQRPTTPLRPLSRSSLRLSYTPSQGGYNPYANPLSSLEPAFAELSDSMADLEANFMHLQLMQESLARFSDCFASFLYGLNVNAWCVDFPEVT